MEFGLPLALRLVQRICGQGPPRKSGRRNGTGRVAEMGRERAGTYTHLSEAEPGWWEQNSG